MGREQRALITLILVAVMASIFIIVNVPIKLGLDLQGGSQLTIQVKTTAEVKKIEPEDLASVMKVVENRINALGVSESLIQSVGNNQLLVQLPGVNDPQQAERVLGGTAQLEFRKQKTGSEGQFLAERQVELGLKSKQQQLLKSDKKDEKAIAENKVSLDKSNKAIADLFEKTGLTGKNLKNAYPQPTSSENWEIGLKFDSEGGKIFADITKDLAGTGRSIGIFLDNELISSPTVGPEFAKEGITGGSAVITGRFTTQEASELSAKLRGGSLPFPVQVVENRTVGATLGKDSIQRSVYAGIGGLILVLIFMGIYYRLPGIVADVSLIIYTILSLAGFALLGVALSLPGIAGFILSIGMAVDANVLIFERTREELRAGKTLYRSVESGFYRAFSSIWDGNFTTLIACAALFWLGSGLVKGFALTLALGVVVSMFTAITCSRTLLLLLVLGFPGIRQKPELFCPGLNQQNN